ncbi:MAG: hypothetical protein IPL38_11610 [Rhodobacter sp.]|nr:hypothetical protein [Rhodobacter sp.]
MDSRCESSNVKVVQQRHDTAEEKLGWLGNTPASRVDFDRVEPDAKANWVNQSDNDWDSLLAIADKKTKLAKSKGQDRAIFKQVSFGLASNRDDGAYDLVQEQRLEKAAFFIDHYDKDGSFGLPLDGTVRSATMHKR